jgi:hypothetical protein
VGGGVGWRVGVSRRRKRGDRKRVENEYEVSKRMDEWEVNEYAKALE